MPFINPLNSPRAFLTAICLCLCLAPCLAWGEEGDETLGLLTAWKEEPSASSRAPKPLSRTAENVTVVTATEIEALNAHTLADVLATIPGVQTNDLGGPGSVSYTLIQSSNFNHVLVLVDGIPLNNSNNFSDTALVPARIIDRIEIVKGAASSAWGQALGGVINVITKSPDQGRALGGTASASIGERTTSDDSVELSGTSGRLGYYLSGGFLGTNGILPNTQLSSNNAYAKVSYNLPDQGLLTATLNYSRADRGNLFIPQIDLRERQEAHDLYAGLAFSRPLTERLSLDILGRYAFRNEHYFDSQISDNTPLTAPHPKEHVSGGDIKLTWRGDTNLVVGGVDYEHFEFTTTDTLSDRHADTLRQKVDRWGAYLNDTLSIGPLALIPGARFDHTQSAGDQFSPSFGMTYQVGENTVLRGYTARGYSLPTLILDRGSEKVWTSQVGAESGVIPYLWLKGTLFRNQTWNVQAFDSQGNPFGERHIALGTELEVRTTPVWHTSLGAGYTFTDTTRSSNGTEVYGDPRHTVQLALRYDDATFRGVLTGRHIWWNQDPSYLARYYGVIWDLHLGATLYKRENSALEVFFSGHNLFNGAQFPDSFTPNTSRWFEGGIKVRF